MVRKFLKHSHCLLHSPPHPWKKNLIKEVMVPFEVSSDHNEDGISGAQRGVVYAQDKTKRGESGCSDWETKWFGTDFHICRSKGGAGHNSENQALHTPLQSGVLNSKDTRHWRRLTPWSLTIMCLVARSHLTDCTCQPLRHPENGTLSNLLPGWF